LLHAGDAEELRSGLEASPDRFTSFFDSSLIYSATAFLDQSLYQYGQAGNCDLERSCYPSREDGSLAWARCCPVLQSDAIALQIENEGFTMIKRPVEGQRAVRENIRLSRSEVLSGAELYAGEDVETFATDWHFHEGWQLVALSKGERHYQLRSGTVIAKPGRLIVLPPRLVHRARCMAKGKTSFKIATLPGVGVDAGVSSAAISQAAPRLVDAFVSVFGMLALADDGKAKAKILCRLQEILTESIAVSGPASLAPPAPVLQMEAYMLERLDRVPSLDLLSSLVGLSRFHVTRTFSKHVGLSPLAFHARARLMQARHLIAQGWSLAETSAYLNFSDQSHFGRHFRRVYGMTPGEYQQNVGGSVRLQARCSGERPLATSHRVQKNATRQENPASALPRQDAVC
jgi:AraC-like DNA-binding protein